ncbi:MAG: type II toxin-antitoxin system RelE/ParE family toxin [Clostridia bacterium]|nr:type II toxin-antitoxin system RelE/ParE family toxin [Clostridia bacterium]
MYSVKFYKDKNGNEPVKEYLTSLAARTDKDSRINLNKIREYIKILAEYGTRAGEPYIKHIDGDLWELRPLRNRIMFFCYDGEQYVLLSHFIKKTQKTPTREIDNAKRLMQDHKERSKQQ